MLKNHLLSNLNLKKIDIHNTLLKSPHIMIK